MSTTVKKDDQDDDLKKAAIRTKFIEKVYAVMRKINDSNPKGKLPKKNILGVDVGKTLQDEILSFKNHTTMELTEKNEGEDSNMVLTKSKMIDFNLEVLPQSFRKIIKPMNTNSFLQTEVQLQAPISRTTLMNIDELISSPVNIRHYKSISPDFKFRSMRSEGAVPVLNKTEGVVDPVTAFNTLVAWNLPRASLTRNLLEEYGITYILFSISSRKTFLYCSIYLS